MADLFQILEQKYPLRQPYQSETNFFNQSKNVGGYAAPDSTVVLNPFSSLKPDEKQAVANNERIRLALQQTGIQPQFEITKEQQEFFKGTPYESDPNALRSTIVARILSGDPSAKATQDQVKQASSIKDQLSSIFRPDLNQSISNAIYKMNPSLRQDGSALPTAIAQTVLPTKSPQWIATQQAMSQGASQAGLPSFTATPDNSSARLQLKDAIDRLKSTGLNIPHFIGNPNEPQGDRASTMDIENLVNGLKTLEGQAAAVGDREALSNISKERAYWQNEMSQGMTAEEWKAQTGENDPIYQR